MITSKPSQSHNNFEIEIDGQKKDYLIRELTPDFVSWNLDQRKTALRTMLSAVGDSAPHGKSGGGFGSHLPVCITNNPAGSLFPVNAATKGTGFVAKAEYLDYYLDKFRAVREQTDTKPGAPADELAEATRTRIATILDFYEDIDKIDLRCLAGLEIWPGHTTTNFALDPRVSLHFLGMPSREQPLRYNQWQVNCIWERTEPGNKRFEFGVALRALTMGHVGKSFIPGHIPTEQTPIQGKYPNGWTLWVVETLDKGIDAIGS